MVKSPPADAGDLGDAGSVPGSEEPLEEGPGSPLPCSRLEHPVGRGAWWATAHGVAASRTCPKRLSTHARV